MPRTYKKSTKPYKSHNTETLSKAVEAVERGSTFRKAAADFGIHYSVIYRHFKNKGKMKKQGGQTVLSSEEEEAIVKNLIICAEWGYPVDPFDLRIIIQSYLNRQGRKIKQFKDNLPGRDFVYSFLKRNKESLAFRFCQNIKRSRAAVSRMTVKEYFDNLAKELDGIPSSHIVNYDETNLADDPGRKRVIVRRGCKYPERVMNSSKSSTSVMFAAAADGTMLPPYVVYRSTHLYSSWTEGGPPSTRYNRTKSGWFDMKCFEDWVKTVAIPYFRNLPGKKVLLGDNLSSHLSLEAIKLCKHNDISFVFLPANSTHLLQPLDVAVFHPLKVNWRSTLEAWKTTPVGRRAATVPKDVFPRLLKELVERIRNSLPENVRSGFRKCGIVPLNSEEVLRSIPSTSNDNLQDEEKLNSSFEDFLKSLRYGDSEEPAGRSRRKRMAVEPGRSVSCPDDPEEEPLSEEEAIADESDDDEVDDPGMVIFHDGQKGINRSNDEDDIEAVDVDDEGSYRYQPGQWVLVQFEGRKPNEFVHFVGQIQDLLDNGEYQVKFARKQGLNRFKWPALDDVSDVQFAEILSVLPEPEVEGNKERVAVFHFDASFQGLTVH